MFSEIVSRLNKLAGDIKDSARDQVAPLLEIAATLEKDAAAEKEAAELIAAEEAYIKEAIDECDGADREITASLMSIEAARKRKKKWVQAIGLKKGRLTSYKKPGESMMDAARRSLKSSDPSVRGMGSFFLATRKFKHKKKGKGKD
jgi:hypothetical protein